MASRQDKIKAIRDEIGGDVTVSMVDSVAQSCGDDKQKILEFFKASVGEDQAKATFQEVVNFLRNAMPIYGAPDSLYEDCVRRANNDMSLAMDFLMEARNNIRQKPAVRGPAPSPIVAPPVYNPPAAKPAAPAPAPAPAKPLPAPAAEPAPAPVESSPAPAKPHPAVTDAAAATKPNVVPAKPLPQKPLSLDEKARMSEAEFHKEAESQRKGAEERARRAKENDKYLEELRAKQEELQARIASMSSSAEEAKKIEEEIHRVEVEQSVIQSKIAATPDYMVGRLPTDECEISVTVTDMVISFTWKISEKIVPSPKDWIGLYIHDRQYSNKYEQYIYLGGKREGSSSFTAPTIGYFDLRFYTNKGYVERSRSKPFLVGPKMDVNAKLEGRRKIEVTWDRGSETAGDWMALYPVSTYSNYKYLQQISAASANSDGVVTFDAPRTPGKYEIRYFFTAKRNATGYAFSGKSNVIEIPNEDSLSVIATHPVVRVRWQTFSQDPNNSDWVGLYDSSDDKAERLGWVYLSKKGLMDSVGDHGIAEIETDKLIRLAPEASLPEGSDKWEVRLFNSAPNQPFLRAPFLVKPTEQ